MKEIVSELCYCMNHQKRCVIATIVNVEGSSYQKSGARCIIHDDGKVIGILSGGCVEADLATHAQEVLSSQKPKLIYYNFRATEDDIWGLGVGCNGAISVWLQLFDPVQQFEQATSILQDYSNRLQCVTSYFVYTIIQSEPLSLFTVGKTWCDYPEMRAALTKTLFPDDVLIDLGIMSIMYDGKKLDIFVEEVHAVPHLSIIGVGEDANLLAQMASMMGWYVRIVYHKTDRAELSKLPYANEIYHIPRANFSSMVNSSREYVVVMTHNIELDREAVKQLITKSEVEYIGVLGSKYRINSIIDYVVNNGEMLVDMKKLHAPIGLNIGSRTPREITLSIMAELIANWNKQKGEPLRESVKHEMEAYCYV